MKNSLYVQYGCGMSSANEWTNYDASPTLRFERLPILGKLYTRNKTRFPANVDYGDIVKGLPVGDAYCKGVYCSHVLEHLALKDFRIALKNTYRILNNGGVFRLVVPDLEYFVHEYIKDKSPESSILFLKNTSLGHEYRPKGLTAFVKEWLGNSAHLWMWDYKSIQLELGNAGFKNIRRAYFNDSVDMMFKYVEDSERWTNCLGVECTRG